jgi:hypothetical protein
VPQKQDLSNVALATSPIQRILAMIRDMTMQEQARIFISCGQTERSDELDTAHEIGRRLKSLDFDYWIASEQQTLRGLKENIFKQLEDSEYFIFVDFRRQKLDDGPDRRGSLFSHQELALASYLNLEILAFQEEGVKKLDGLISFLQANAESFSDRTHLPDTVECRVREKIEKKEWDRCWKNALRLEREPGQYVDAPPKPPTTRRIFHIRVSNLHWQKPALNCCAYLERAVDLKTRTAVPLTTIEYKWAGYQVPDANILPKQYREFDAFWVDPRDSCSLGFGTFADNKRFQPPIRRPGDYELTFLVVSQNFGSARQTFHFHCGSSLEDIKFEAKPL